MAWKNGLISFLLYIMLYEYVLCQVLPDEFEFSTPNIFKNGNFELLRSVKSTESEWPSYDSNDDSKETVRKIWYILTKESENRQKITIEIDKYFIPTFFTFFDNYTVKFSNLQTNNDPYSSSGDYSDFNEFTCAENLQVNISKAFRVINFSGYVTIFNSSQNIRDSDIFTIILENALVSNIHHLQIDNYNQAKVNATYSETNMQYQNIKLNFGFGKLNSVMFDSISGLLSHIESFLHAHIDSGVLEKINNDLPVPSDFQCSPTGIGTYSMLLNKVYVIIPHKEESSETHSIDIGPVRVKGFSNITNIKWEYAWSYNNQFYRKISINFGSLYIVSDWSLSVKRKDTSTFKFKSGFDKFITKKASLISKSNYQGYNYNYNNGFSFDVNVESRAVEEKESMDEIVGIMVDEHIEASLASSLNTYGSNHQNYG